MPSFTTVASKLGSPSEPPSPKNGAEPDLASVLAALERERSTADDAHCSARASRRGFLTLVLIGLLIGGVIQLATSTPDPDRTAKGETRSDVVFGSAKSGTCLNWPVDAPDKPSFVWCTDDHMFEVAKPVDMTNFGEPCQLAVRQYLGDRYDPSSRFTIAVVWPGDAVGAPPGQRNLLCGLQLIGPGGRPIPFKGKIAELDQSRVWPVGTCLGIDQGTRRSTDVPSECSSPHALEVTGAVNLGERFTAGPPAEADQQAFLTDACTRAADAYLAPRTVSSAGLAISFDPVSAESWSAGSRQVACSVGDRRASGWAPLVGNLRAPQPADVPPAAPPPPPPPPPTSDEPPPPVYEEPLVPVAPETATVAPTATSAPTTTATTPPLGPPPGPPPGAEPTTTQPQPGVFEIPGMAPITLPWMVPPPPPPPPPPAA